MSRKAQRQMQDSIRSLRCIGNSKKPLNLQWNPAASQPMRIVQAD